MPQEKRDSGDIVEFLRKRDYMLLRELGQGACGKTVLLRDDMIDELFVCKKYVPYAESQRQELYSNFVREVKLLHRIHHDNLVRVFNYYLYPNNQTGYILMEHVDGKEIDDYIKTNPVEANELFIQTMNGFAYLEGAGILHRDIRAGNLMVRDDGRVKIIDLGFGKKINSSGDFEKSISLNWWCEVPDEFAQSVYDFATEVYFVGKLFEQLIRDNAISHFKYVDLLRRMCIRNPTQRIRTFAAVLQSLRSDPFFEIEFIDDELRIYREFSDNIAAIVAQIDNGAKYQTDLALVEGQLNDVYRKCMLEAIVPDPATVIRCLFSGNYTYYKNRNLTVETVKNFIRLLKSTTEEKKRIVLANLHTKLDTVERYDADKLFKEDDIPF